MGHGTGADDAAQDLAVILTAHPPSLGEEGSLKLMLSKPEQVGRYPSS